MRKYNGLSNVTGQLIEKALKNKKMTQETLCKKLQLYGINIDRFHLYRIMTNAVIVKDFELIAICKILDIDYEDIKNTVINIHG